MFQDIFEEDDPNIEKCKIDYDSFEEAMSDINNNSPTWKESEYALFINIFNEEYIY